jgi:hypothetical protein
MYHFTCRAIHPLRLSVFAPIMALAAGCGGSSVPAPVEAVVTSEYSPRETEVVEVVASFLKAISERDGAMMEALSLPGGSVHAVVLGDEGSLKRISSRSLADDAERIPADPDPLLERMWDPVAMVHGRLAMVWTPYDFWVAGEWSHCGIDAFTLVETDNGWRVSSISYTSEISDCPESPLPPPSEAELGVNQQR